MQKLKFKLKKAKINNKKHENKILARIINIHILIQKILEYNK